MIIFSQDCVEAVNSDMVFCYGIDVLNGVRYDLYAAPSVPDSDDGYIILGVYFTATAARDEFEKLMDALVKKEVAMYYVE